MTRWKETLCFSNERFHEYLGEGRKGKEKEKENESEERRDRRQEKEGEKERRRDAAVYLSMVGRQREKERARRGERAPSPTHPPVLLLYPPYLLTKLTNG